MTNHTSRAPNRNNRAADRMFTLADLEKISENFGLFLALPRSDFKLIRLPMKTNTNTAAIAATAYWKPIKDNNAPPKKNPAPFKAFFDPVRIAIHLNNAPCAFSGTKVLMALLALILLRSFAMPDMACAAITQGMVNQLAGTASIKSAMICKPSPMFMVRFSPSRAPSHPPIRLVTTPKNS